MDYSFLMSIFFFSLSYETSCDILHEQSKIERSSSAKGGFIFHETPVQLTVSVGIFHFRMKFRQKLILLFPRLIYTHRETYVCTYACVLLYLSCSIFVKRARSSLFNWVTFIEFIKCFWEFNIDTRLLPRDVTGCNTKINPSNTPVSNRYIDRLLPQ